MSSLKPSTSHNSMSNTTVNNRQISSVSGDLNTQNSLPLKKKPSIFSMYSTSTMKMTTSRSQPSPSLKYPIHSHQALNLTIHSQLNNSLSNNHSNSNHTQQEYLISCNAPTLPKQLTNIETVIHPHLFFNHESSPCNDNIEELLNRFYNPPINDSKHHHDDNANPRESLDKEVGNVSKTNLVNYSSLGT